MPTYSTMMVMSAQRCKLCIYFYLSIYLFFPHHPPLNGNAPPEDTGSSGRPGGVVTQPSHPSPLPSQQLLGGKGGRAHASCLPLPPPLAGGCTLLALPPYPPPAAAAALAPPLSLPCATCQVIGSVITATGASNALQPTRMDTPT